MIKRAFCILLTIVLALGITACGSKDDSGKGGSGEGSELYSESLLPELNVKGTKVKYLCWGSSKDLKTEGTYLYEMNQKLLDAYGCELEIVRTTYDELPTKLAQLVMSNNSPDIVHYKYQDNPSFVLNDLVTEITKDVIDFDTPLWKDIKDVNEEYAFQGKIFTPIYDIVNDGYIYYHTNLFKEAGLDTPLDYYRRGEWDWDTMIDLAKKLTQKASDGTVKIYGFAGAPEYFYMTTGVDFVKTNPDGTVTNNLSDPLVAKAMNLFYRSGTVGSNCRMPMGYSQTEFMTGSIAMLYDEAWSKSLFYDKIKADEIAFAPSPKMPGSDKYYVNSLISTHWIAKNAPNLDGAVAYLSLLRAQVVDPKISAAERQKEMERMGFTEEEYALIDEMNDRTKFTFTRRVGPGVGNFGNTGMYDMFNEVSAWDIAWSTCLEKYTPLLQEQIDAHNKKVLAYGK